MVYLLYLFFFPICIFVFYQVWLKNQEYIDYLSNKDYNNLSNYTLIKEREKKEQNTFSNHQKLKNLIKVKYVLKSKLETIKKDILIISKEIREDNYKIDYSIINDEYNDLIKKEGNLIGNNEH
jgi:hypothetical protein